MLAGLVNNGKQDAQSLGICMQMLKRVEIWRFDPRVQFLIFQGSYIYKENTTLEYVFCYVRRAGLQLG